MIEAPYHPLRAAGYMMGAMVSFSLMAVAGRELSSTLDTFEIMMYRSIIGIVIVLGVAKSTGTIGDIKFRRMKMHVLRNAMHFIGQNLWFFALVHIPLSQLFAFEFTSPLWVAILAPFVLGESMTRTRILAFVLGFIGILIVARPETSGISPATLAAAFCALGFAGAMITTKLLGQTEATISILFWLVTLQALFGLICAGYDGEIAVPGGVALIWVAIVGFCGLLAHFCITTALKLAPATIVSPLEFMRLPLIAVVAWIVYSEPIEIAVFVGALIVFCANYLNIRSQPNPRPAKSQA